MSLRSSILSFVASFNCSTEDPNFEILFANFQILPIIPITPAIITRSISIIIHFFHYFLFIYLRGLVVKFCYFLSLLSMVYDLILYYIPESFLSFLTLTLHRNYLCHYE